MEGQKEGWNDYGRKAFRDSKQEGRRSTRLSVTSAYTAREYDVTAAQRACDERALNVL